MNISYIQISTIEKLSTFLEPGKLYLMKEGSFKRVFKAKIANDNRSIEKFSYPIKLTIRLPMDSPSILMFISYKKLGIKYEFYFLYKKDLLVFPVVSSNYNYDIWLTNVI